MNFSTGPTLSSPCAYISIQSTGDSTQAQDGWYVQYLFGTYRFVSIDSRANNMYQANIKGTDWFLSKLMDNDWVVNITILHRLIYQYYGKLG